MLTKLVPFLPYISGAVTLYPLLSYHRVAFRKAAHHRGHLGAMPDGSTHPERPVMTSTRLVLFFTKRQFE